jgi:hypothetical protein
MLFKRPDRSAKPAKPVAPAGPARHVFAKAPPPPAAKKTGSRPRHDIVIAAAGVALGLTCALFPWYIFFNQDQFGPPSVKFAGTDVEASADDATATPIMPRGNSDVRIVGIPDLSLDYTPTGSLSRTFSPPVNPAPEQPFPEVAAPFKVLHVTAGRAMIEDDTGIWVVQPGSTLPDRTRVETIERRKGKWVVVTSSHAVLSASN